MGQNEVEILSIINRRYALDLEQLIRVTDVIEENYALCNSLCQQGYLEKKRLGGLQVTSKGKNALLQAQHATEQVPQTCSVG